ncbi:MAG: acyl-CoA thioesterase [gamma proteobacterium symbiont of Taylorina sp.]|nr:acyl-CoA thioesterase [gamma proteobacterium symbiont of Taylorina sp.]
MSSTLFKHSFTTRIHDIDAAGVVFFGQFFYHIHNAYEAFLNHHQYGIDRILNYNVILPIKHTEADFIAPVLLNETISIEIFLEHINNNEFSLSYHLYDINRTIRAKALTQHICLDKETKKHRDLPDDLAALFLTTNNRQ